MRKKYDEGTRFYVLSFTNKEIIIFLYDGAFVL